MIRTARTSSGRSRAQPEAAERLRLSGCAPFTGLVQIRDLLQAALTDLCLLAQAVAVNTGAAEPAKAAACGCVSSGCCPARHAGRLENKPCPTPKPADAFAPSTALAGSPAACTSTASKNASAAPGARP
jgi:hypothetical protein